MPATINDNDHYEVQLSKAVKIGPSWFRPSHNKVVIKGSVLKTIQDDVSSYKKV